MAAPCGVSIWVSPILRSERFAPVGTKVTSEGDLWPYRRTRRGETAYVGPTTVVRWPYPSRLMSKISRHLLQIHPVTTPFSTGYGRAVADGHTNCGASLRRRSKRRVPLRSPPPSISRRSRSVDPRRSGPRSGTHVRSPGSRNAMRRPVACCLLPVACCLLPVACCLLPTITFLGEFLGELQAIFDPDAGQAMDCRF
jgi:hypothetical protein